MATKPYQKRRNGALQRLAGSAKRYQIFGPIICCLVAFIFALADAKFKERAARESQLRLEKDTREKIGNLERQIIEALPAYTDLRDQFRADPQNPKLQNTFLASRTQLGSVFREANELIARLADEYGHPPNFILPGWRCPSPENRGGSSTNIDGREYIVFTSYLWEPLLEDFSSIIKDIYRSHKTNSWTINNWPSEEETLKTLVGNSIGDFQYIRMSANGSNETISYAMKAKLGESHFLLPNNHAGKPISW